MSIDLGTTQVVDASVSACPDGERTRPLHVEASYDGSNVVFRLLRMETWGPALMNLGFHRFRGPFAFLNWVANLELAQRRLVMKSLDLLNVERRHRVLDVACGRGKSSFIVRCMYPEATVVGVDLLEQNIQVARTLFDKIGNLSYVAGNAMALDFPDASFDRVMCLEAAFEFPDRAQFLHEACRVLRPGGRLIVVDFAWNTDADRTHRDDPETQVVREIWEWEDLFSISEYERVARESGFRIVSRHDWSQWVTRPIQGLFHVLSLLGNNWLGRRFLQWRNPLYRSFSIDDWRNAARAFRVHKHAQRYSKYMAFVFEKQFPPRDILSPSPPGS
jgi:MPBQ/MSBQ methyltransferase